MNTKIFTICTNYIGFNWSTDGTSTEFSAITSPEMSRNVSKMISYIVVAAFGIPGNVLTIIVLLSARHLRMKPVNLFMVHQSFIDLIVCCMVILQEIFFRMNQVPEGLSQVIYCRLWMTKYVVFVPLYTSTYNLVFLTLERHLAITNPLRYNQEKVLHRLPYVFASCWILCGTILAFTPSTTILRDGKCLLIYELLAIPRLQRIVIPYIAIMAVLLPTAIMLIAYIRMGIALQKSMTNLNMSSDKKNNTHVEKSRQAQINLFQTCLLMVILFVLSWVAVETIMAPYIFGYVKSLSNDYYNVAILIAISNSCFNPYVYTIRYNEFKKQLAVLLNRARHLKSTPAITTTTSRF